MLSASPLTMERRAGSGSPRMGGGVAATNRGGRVCTHRRAACLHEDAGGEVVGVHYRDRPATDSLDLPVVQQWVARNPNADARLTETTAHGGDQVLVISIPAHEQMVLARIEIPPLVQFPELLRIRRWRPTEQETEWTLQWVLGLMRRQEDLGLPTRVTSAGPHPVSGLIEITLDRVDHAYAAELETRGDGLVFVLPDPVTPVPLAVARNWPPGTDRVPAAPTPTWVTLEKPRADLP
jgi:hypothetical protein